LDSVTTSVSSTGSKLEKAASEIAQKLGGDTEKTEKELLEIYLGRALSKTKTTTKDSDYNDVKKESKRVSWRFSYFAMMELRYTWNTCSSQTGRSCFSRCPE